MKSRDFTYFLLNKLELVAAEGGAAEPLCVNQSEEEDKK